MNDTLGYCSVVFAWIELRFLNMWLVVLGTLMHVQKVMECDLREPIKEEEFWSLEEA